MAISPPLTPRKKGNSIWINVTSSTLNLIDSTWANWSGSWAVLDSAGGTTLLSGTMTKHPTDLGKFYIRITPTQCNTLNVGNYILTSQVQNATAEYLQEFDDEVLKIKAGRIA